MKLPQWFLNLVRANEGEGQIIIPLDVPTTTEAIALADRMAVAGVRWFKVGLELLSTLSGAETVIKYLLGAGWYVFLDGKFHDIPNTVAGAVRNAVKLGVQIINVHCTGGLKMMQAAAEAAEKTAAELGINRPLIIGVTILTSLDLNDLFKMGLCSVSKQQFELFDNDEIKRQLLAMEVIKLAQLAQEAGLDGVIASANHAEAIRRYCGPDFVIVTPGIRFAEGDAHDQKQVDTPFNAAKNGATLLVIGRAITQAPDPAEAVARAGAEIRAGRAA